MGIFSTIARSTNAFLSGQDSLRVFGRLSEAALKLLSARRRKSDHHQTPALVELP